MTHLPVKSKFSESLGDSRYLSVDVEKEVTIGDHDRTAKRALLSATRWLRLVSQMDDIDAAVERAATLKPTQYKVHVGGNWFISVNEELPFVDIRRWYTKGTETVFRPSLTGISLTFAQWNALKEVSKLDVMKKEFEDVEVEEEEDNGCVHLSQRDQEQCAECGPCGTQPFESR